MGILSHLISYKKGTVINMKIQTDYFGEIEYEESDLIIVPDGFFGFSKLTRFLPLMFEEDDDSLLLMQSVEKAEIAFIMVSPTALIPEYAPVLSKEDLDALDAENSGELGYYAICVIKNNYLEDTVNLKCPLAIHPETKMARQVILEGQPYGYRHKLNSFPTITERYHSENREES